LGIKIVALMLYLMFVYILYTAYNAFIKGRMFERLKRRFFDIKITGRFDKIQEEDAYCGMFVSLEGLVVRYSEMAPMTVIVLWLSLTCRCAHPLIEKTGWAKDF